MLAQDLLTKEGIMSSELDGTEIRVNIGDAVTGKGEGAGISLWANGDGFISMPNQPSKDGACHALVHRDGNSLRVVATKDNRFVGQYASLQPGDRAIVSDSKARVFLKKSTDSVSIYTQDGDDNPIIVDVSGENGNVTIMVAGPNGTSIFQQDADEIKLTAGGSSLVINADGVTISGQRFWSAAGMTLLGQLGGAAPLPANPVLWGTTGPAGLPSSNVFVSA